ncbi:RloB family protein [Actinotignum timonense]|uniref:RloB family protein n=1 Tax=Actinotignum TaxID=1653174 RepID=UPI0025500A4E|nr:RloB family protein [Actinotignum timonense]MDK6906868.1 RloB family protein [Actinotignum timonense]MDY5138807.1 RloB family protein [Actinotignum timonense]
MVACEGKTEFDYIEKVLAKAQDEYTFTRISVRNQSALPNLIEDAKREEKYESLLTGDIVVIVTDRDSNKEADLEALAAWAAQTRGKHKRIIAFSNPCFEFWLCLHFADNPPHSSPKHCIKELERHVGRYKKGNIQAKYFDPEIAVKRARFHAIDHSGLQKWFDQSGTTSMGEFVKLILGLQEP